MMLPRRWWFGVPFIFALAVLVFLVWAVSLAIWYPHDGISYITPDGYIKSFDLESQTSNYLQVDDRILEVDGNPFSETESFYASKSPGDIALIQVQRGDQIVDVQLELAHPTSVELFNRLAPIGIAFIFWMLGVGIQALKPSKDVSNIFFLFFESAALLLIAGANSALGPVWPAMVLRFMLWMIGPVAVHFHLHFPQTTNFRGRNILLLILYWLGCGFGLIYASTLQLNPNILFVTLLQSANRLFLAVNLLLVVVLLFYVYRHHIIAGVRSKIRIVVLGGVLCVIPLVTFILLPEALLREPIIPISFSFLFLAIIPLTYGYAIFRYQLIEIEKHVNRGATLVLVYSILIVIYLVIYSTLQSLLSDTVIKTPLINTILVMTLASIFIPLHRWVQRVVDIAFYGGWYEYRTAVSQITGGLEQVTDLNDLADITSQRLVQVLRLEAVCIFLADQMGNFSTRAVAPKPLPDSHHTGIGAPLPRSSLSYLLTMGGIVERNALRRALSEVSLSSQELELLESEQNGLWVPIIGHGEMIGYMALGSKFGGDPYSDEDVDILLVVSRHLSPLIENIHLVTRLRDYASELEKHVADRTVDLANAKKHVEAILSSVGEGVIVTNLDGIIDRVNLAFLRQTGYRERDIRGRKLWDCYEITDLSSRLQEIQFAVSQNQMWSGELVGNRKDGRQFDVQLTITPLYDDSANLIGYVVSQRDITQQKELDRLKDIFVSDVSHELRTPTTNIGLYLELMENAPQDKQKYYLNVLKEQSQLLVRLVEDILDLSRLASGKSRNKEFDFLNLNGLAEQVVMAHRPLAITNGLNLIYDPDPEIPTIMGEPSQISRVINNLVANAIHYTKSGSVTVRTYQNRNGVILDVIDTGIGIDPQDRPHLFERFYRGRNTRQSRIPGTGLGLAIVKEIVERHGSQIEIQSEAGKGTTFSVCFPRVADEIWAVKSY